MLGPRFRGTKLFLKKQKKKLVHKIFIKIFQAVGGAILHPQPSYGCLRGIGRWTNSCQDLCSVKGDTHAVEESPLPACLAGAARLGTGMVAVAVAAGRDSIGSLNIYILWGPGRDGLGLQDSDRVRTRIIGSGQSTFVYDDVMRKQRPVVAVYI